MGGKLRNGREETGLWAAVVLLGRRGEGTIGENLKGGVEGWIWEWAGNNSLVSNEISLKERLMFLNAYAETAKNHFSTILTPTVRPFHLSRKSTALAQLITSVISNYW